MSADRDNVANFIITGHVWSGSRWLAYALDLHPNIICRHGVRNDAPSPPPPGIEGELGSASEDNRNRNDIGVRPANDLLAAIQPEAETVAIGSVLGMRISDLVDIPQITQHPVSQPYKLVNLVRHPVCLVAVGAIDLLVEQQYDVFALLDVGDGIWKGIDFATTLAQRYHLDLCAPEVHCFLAACHHLTLIGRDMVIGSTAPLVPIERLMREPAYFSHAAASLTSITNFGDEYTEHLFPNQALASGATDLGDPEAVFTGWHSWQKEAFIHYLREAQIQTRYQECGYDFSFLE